MKDNDIKKHIPDTVKTWLNNNGYEDKNVKYEYSDDKKYLFVKDTDSKTIYLYDNKKEVGAEVNAYSNNILKSRIKTKVKGTFVTYNTYFTKNNKILVIYEDAPWTLWNEPTNLILSHNKNFFIYEETLSAAGATGHKLYFKNIKENTTIYQKTIRPINSENEISRRLVDKHSVVYKVLKHNKVTLVTFNLVTGKIKETILQ